jgi:hypothetical protein
MRQNAIKSCEEFNEAKKLIQAFLNRAFTTR